MTVLSDLEPFLTIAPHQKSPFGRVLCTQAFPHSGLLLPPKKVDALKKKKQAEPSQSPQTILHHDIFTWAKAPLCLHTCVTLKALPSFFPQISTLTHSHPFFSQNKSFHENSVWSFDVWPTDSVYSVLPFFYHSMCIGELQTIALQS